MKHTIKLNASNNDLLLNTLLHNLSELKEALIEDDKAIIVFIKETISVIDSIVEDMQDQEERIAKLERRELNQ